MYQEARDVSEGGGCRHEDGHRPVTPVTHAVIEVPAGGEGAGLRPPPAGNQDGSSLGPGPGTCPLPEDSTLPLVISQACSGLVVGTWACQGHKEEDKSPQTRQSHCADRGRCFLQGASALCLSICTNSKVGSCCLRRSGQSLGWGGRCTQIQIPTLGGGDPVQVTVLRCHRL